MPCRPRRSRPRPLPGRSPPEPASRVSYWAARSAARSSRDGAPAEHTGVHSCATACTAGADPQRQDCEGATLANRMISIGVLTPHAAAGPEAEFPDMAAGQVGTRVSRIPARDASVAAPGTPPTSQSGLRALTAPTVLDEAAAAFAPGSVDVIGVASTSTGYAIGFDAETTMVARLSKRWSLPVVGTSLAAVAALEALDMDRVSIVHPPWFDDELNDLGATYFRSQGFAVVASVSADLPNDPDRIESGAVVEWISRNVSDEAEGGLHRRERLPSRPSDRAARSEARASCAQCEPSAALVDPRQGASRLRGRRIRQAFPPETIHDRLGDVVARRAHLSRGQAERAPGDPARGVPERPSQLPGGASHPEVRSSPSAAGRRSARPAGSPARRWSASGSPPPHWSSADPSLTNKPGTSCACPHRSTTPSSGRSLIRQVPRL